MSNIQYLYLKSNKIKNITPISKLNLKELDLENNKIELSQVIKTLIIKKSINIINIKNNPIQSEFESLI